MGDLSGNADFAAKALQQLLVVRGFLGQKLESDWLSQSEIVGTVNFAHSAPAKKCNDPVALGENRTR